MKGLEAQALTIPISYNGLVLCTANTTGSVYTTSLTKFDYRTICLRTSANCRAIFSHNVQHSSWRTVARITNGLELPRPFNTACISCYYIRQLYKIANLLDSFLRFLLVDFCIFRSCLCLLGFCLELCKLLFYLLHPSTVATATDRAPDSWLSSRFATSANPG